MTDLEHQIAADVEEIKAKVEEILNVLHEAHGLSFNERRRRLAMTEEEGEEG